MKKYQMSETRMIGTILTLVGGFLDAYTYISRGKVFANAQTGNIVLLGIKFAEGNIIGGLYYLFPIFAFIAGVLLCEKIKVHFKYNPYMHWRQIIILSEIVVLGGSLFIPKGTGDMAANIMVAFVCSLQVQSFRKIKGYTSATTMCTGNLRSGTECLYQYLRFGKKEDKHAFLHYYIIILQFILGAIVGTITTKLFDIKAMVIACLALLIVFVMMFVRGEDEEKTIR